MPASLVGKEGSLMVSNEPVCALDGVGEVGRVADKPVTVGPPGRVLRIAGAVARRTRCVRVRAPTPS